ncbi:HAMP domain-containing histidine kinase [bacterium]|nr:HAMP domain-containing histidine kinase [bacterium]
MEKNTLGYLDIIQELMISSNDNAENTYKHALKKLSHIFNNCSLAVFFTENTDYILKSAIKNQKFIDEYNIKKEIVEPLFKSEEKYIFLKNKKDEFLKNETIIVKLAIKSSVFGFFVFSTDEEIDKTKQKAIITIAEIISYKIKDFELSEVFKLQLRAMQDAILEKNEALDVIKKQHKKLQELDKSKNLFIANISHELRTPLNAIIGFSQALSAKIFGQLNQKQEEYINDIQVSGLHLLGMINEILDISKLEAHAMKLQLSNFEANLAIKEVISILEPLYKTKNIKLDFISNAECTIKADYQKFQQILYNLLSNAIKFTQNNGQITVKTSIKEKNFVLSVKDTGVGIDKKYHNKIFKKFMHINNLDNPSIKNQSSTGLGLTIVKELAKLHKGTIEVKSELSKGSEFIIEFKNMLIE